MVAAQDLAFAVRPSRNGVRPNSPPQTISVSSSSPRCSRSLINAATGLSIVAHLRVRPSRMSSPGFVPWKSQPQSNSWTKRTPASLNRRASRQLLARLESPGLRAVSVQHVLRFLRDVHHLGHRSLHAERQLVLSDAGQRLGMAHLASLQFVQLVQGIQTHPPHFPTHASGSETYSTGSPCERHCTPW
jgi:hypothetical protein